MILLLKPKGIFRLFRNVFPYLKTCQINETLGYVEAVLNSVDDKEIEKVLELYSYLFNNSDSLVPYQNRGIKLLELNKVTETMNF